MLDRKCGPHASLKAVRPAFRTRIKENKMSEFLLHFQITRQKIRKEDRITWQRHTYNQAPYECTRPS